jgi:hypothetical protein
MGNQVERCRDEMIHLIGEQMDALETETYVGLTDEEFRQYDARQARIHELSEKLRSLELH